MTRADVVALRARVHAAADDAIDEAAADVTITRNDGGTLHLFVPHAIGSLQRPMSRDDLARKFHGLVDPVLGGARADALIQRCEGLARAPDLRSLVNAARA